MTPAIIPADIRIVPCTDAVLLADLGSRTFHAAYKDDFPAEQMAEYLSVNFKPEEIAAEISSGGRYFFVAEKGGVPVGYSKLRNDRGHETVSDATLQPALEMQRIYLLADQYATGLGKTLLQHALGYAQDHGYASLWLQVWQENHRAIAFYERNGFDKVGTATFRWPTTVTHDWVMLSARSAFLSR